MILRFQGKNYWCPVIAGLSEAGLPKKIWVRLPYPIPDISSEDGIVALTWRRANPKCFGLVGVHRNMKGFASVEYVVADELYVFRHGWSCLWNDPEKGEKLRRTNSIQGRKNLKSAWKQPGFREKRIAARLKYFKENPLVQKEAARKGMVFTRKPKYWFVLTFPGGEQFTVEGFLSLWAIKHVDVLRAVLPPEKRSCLTNFEVVSRFTHCMSVNGHWYGIKAVKVASDEKV